MLIARRNDHSKRAFPAVVCCVAFAGLATAAALAQVSATPRAAEPIVSIKALMEQAITPATNTLWSAYEPPTDEQQWRELEAAAVTLLVAGQANAAGGTGPMDNEWVQSPVWQAFNRVMIDAGRAALAAARARDHDALLAAGDVLYPPREGCHQQFNPGVVNPQE